jgi:uncharacterized protein (DUF2141 family)
MRLFFYSCASIGSPEGGAADKTPPYMVKSFPADGATHVDRQKIELFFDEYVNIEKPSEKVIITPPQKQIPVIRATGKKISVELKDSLIANTTYTFDFTDGIVDNNEKNPLEDFAFAFSTGDVVDSLMIAGLLLNAETLDPQPHVIVGIHSCLDDSAFTALPFLRTAMTNDRGKFRIRNVAPGNYRLFALKDINRNYRFDMAGEEIAFCDSLIVPSFEPAVRMDTARTDSLTVDAVREIHYTRFTPDNITLFLFQEKSETQYLSRTERPARRRLVFHFNSGQGLPPAISLPEEDAVENIRPDWYVAEYSPDKKDVVLWITDSLLYMRDTIRIKAEYLQTDDSLNLLPVTDTLRFIWKTSRSSLAGETGKTADFLKTDFSLKGVADIFDTLKITFSEPVGNFSPEKIKIRQKIDTLWENRSFPITGDSLNPRIFYINKVWDYGQEFQFTVDSAAISGIYGNWNDSTAATVKFKAAEEYINIYMKITGRESDGFGELLNGSDKVVRTSALYDGELVFENLPPGKYYLRYIEDANGNGKWDAGIYKFHLQPEKVYYYPAPIDLPRKNSDMESEWNIREIPVDRQKPPK